MELNGIYIGGIVAYMVAVIILARTLLALLGEDAAKLFLWTVSLPIALRIQGWWQVEYTRATARATWNR